MSNTSWAIRPSSACPDSFQLYATGLSSLITSRPLASPVTSLSLPSEEVLNVVVVPVAAIEPTWVFASFKIAKAYLLNEKVKEDEINKGTIEELDKLIGKPFNTARNDECNSFIYKLIPGSKADIEKLRGTLK